MVLIYVVYSRRRESTVRYAGPDDDVRENIINYEDEGGGEDDMTAYDITPLQIPIGGQGLGLGLGYDTMKGGKIPCKQQHFDSIEISINEFNMNFSFVLDWIRSFSGTDDDERRTECRRLHR